MIGQTGDSANDGLGLKDENGSGTGTVGVAASGDQRIDGLLSQVRWATGAISYSDPDSVTDYQAGYEENLTNFQQVSANQLMFVHATLSDTTITQPSGAYSYSVGGFTNLAISYAGSGSGGGTIRVANTDDPYTAYAYYPSAAATGGDAFFGPSGRNPTTGNYDAYTIIHELGHALGLKHGHETTGYGALPSATDSMEYSVMTYRSYVGSDAQFVYNEEYGYAQTFMMYDIAALQYMYGADFNHNGGNTTYTWSPTTGQAFVNGNLGLSPGANRIFETIWDGNGTDTYDLSNYSTNLTIDLTPGGYSVFSSAQLADLDVFGDHIARGNVFNALQYQGDLRSLIENANGGSGNDVITGNQGVNTLIGNAGNDTIDGGAQADTVDGRTGNDTVRGGVGNDTVLGGQGTDVLHGDSGSDVLRGGTQADTLIGGLGADRFDFDTAAESAPGGRDSIIAGDGAIAFEGVGGAASRGDHIDVSGIDANTTSGGNQAFILGGTGKGHLSLVNSGSDTIVHANTDNDAAFEFELRIADGGGVTAGQYNAGDFIL